MNKVKPKEILSKRIGGEFLIALRPGDIFVSFHLANENCLGFYLLKNEFNSVILEDVYQSILGLFSNTDMTSAEVKLIGCSVSIGALEDFLKQKNIVNIKKIGKENSVEVMFLPSLNKVRVSKDPTASYVSPTLTRKFKILIVDDSKTIRNILYKIFSSDSELEVCAMAEKPSEVEDLILKYKPDVITLDIHMPEMDGVTLLKIIGPKFNIPTVMISSISMAEGPLVLEALENGAIDYIQKPELSEIQKVSPLIIEKVKTAAMANLSKISKVNDASNVQTKFLSDLNCLVVLGASTGGTEAIRKIITSLPDKIPPILIVQHIPAIFSAAFAKRMNELCPFLVKEAENGDEVVPNQILIAPGGKQMKFKYKNGKGTVEINDDDPVNRFKPSVDYLFFSVAKNLYTSTISILLLFKKRPDKLFNLLNIPFSILDILLLSR